MDESILTSIKKLLGLTEDYTAFDDQLIMHINSVILVLKQIGVCDTAYTVRDKTDTWSELLTSDKDFEAVKSYMGMKVRSLFDPPTTSVVADSMNRAIAELEWRLNAEAETEQKEVSQNE